MNKTTRLVLAILTVITVLSGIGFYFVSSVAPSFAGLYLLVLYMPTPLLSLVIAKYLFRQQLRILPAMPQPKTLAPNLLFVMAIPFTWVLILLGASALLSRLNPDVFGVMVGSMAQYAEHLSQMQGVPISASELPPAAVLVVVAIAQIIVLGMTINSIAAFGEEALWRGYLPGALRGSFYPKYLTIGAIWGLWHAPINIQGYNYGVQYRVPGAALFVVFCAVFGLLFGVVVERTGNVVFSALLHGLFNATASVVPQLIISDNTLLNGAVGVVSIGAMAVTFAIFRLIDRRLPSTKEAPRSPAAPETQGDAPAAG